MAHRPLPCDIYEKWLNITGGQDQTATDLWIKAFTKKCPKC